jgi:hypothetical protein
MLINDKISGDSIFSIADFKSPLWTTVPIRGKLSRIYRPLTTWFTESITLKVGPLSTVWTQVQTLKFAKVIAQAQYPGYRAVVGRRREWGCTFYMWTSKACCNVGLSSFATRSKTGMRIDRVIQAGTVIGNTILKKIVLKVILPIDQGPANGWPLHVFSSSRAKKLNDQCAGDAAVSKHNSSVTRRNR